MSADNKPGKSPVSRRDFLKTVSVYGGTACLLSIGVKPEYKLTYLPGIRVYIDQHGHISVGQEGQYNVYRADKPYKHGEVAIHNESTNPLQYGYSNPEDLLGFSRTGDMKHVNGFKREKDSVHRDDYYFFVEVPKNTPIIDTKLSG